MTPRAAAFALALALAACLAADLLWMPVQVFDALHELLDAHRFESVADAFRASIGGAAYMRPMRIAQIKALFDLADGHYWAAFRGFHALLMAACLLLFTAALRVRTTADWGAAAVALAVLTGLHTFRATVQEAFPINHFLEMVVFCLLTLALARSRGGWWADLLAMLTFAVAALTLESGLLVWVVAAAAWLVGWRGISWRGIGGMTLLLALYFYARFVALGTGTPGLEERSTGFLLRVLEPEELVARFGANPLPLYAYNVAASALSVLFSEPRAGVFAAVGSWLGPGLLPRELIHLSTSLATTLLIVWAAVAQVRRRVMDDTLRLILVFAAVLGANAALSYAYTKDDIITIAGAFYALAAFAAVRRALEVTPGGSFRRAVVVAALMMLCAGWAMRALNLHYIMRAQAFRQQNDWVELPARWQRSGDWPEDPAAQRLILHLQDEAIGLRIPNVGAEGPRWVERVWYD